jgi:hypothetical protein
MMQGQLNKEELAHQISLWGKELLTARQVYSRLHRLLPARYMETVRRISISQKSGKSRRLALLDPTYLAYLDELNHLGYSILKAKVKWETHLLLYKCKSHKKL